ncbi:hypothetical protein AVEN_181162-1 [Araneus ventricosus]|uniref:Uncharacterized protein n=1 Tax=Araneus ventricosus TaxID=182803 RepID=A0A4Y2VCC4_ARAVE|nr:hypothetical protein AVEN_181162-1 [Araneus ventricosus]
MLDTGVFMRSKSAWLQGCFEVPSLTSAVDVTKERCSHRLSVEEECGRVPPSFGHSRKLAGENCGFPSTRGAGNGVGGGGASKEKKNRGSIEGEINAASAVQRKVISDLDPSHSMRVGNAAGGGSHFKTEVFEDSTCRGEM